MIVFVLKSILTNNSYGLKDIFILNKDDKRRTSQKYVFLFLKIMLQTDGESHSIFFNLK